MTLEVIHRRARELRAKTRRQLVGTLAAPLATIFFYVFAIGEFKLLGNALHGMFAFTLVWSLVGLYFLNRRMWSMAMPADAGLSTGLEFCRRETERRRYLLQRVLLWSFGPLMLAIATFMLALAILGSRNGGIFPNGLPFLAFVLIWILGYFFQRWREQRELKREIDELDDIERNNRL